MKKKIKLIVVFVLSCTVIACSSNTEGTEKKTDNSQVNNITQNTEVSPVNGEANNTYTSEAKELEEKENVELSDKYFIGFDYCFYDIYNPGRIIECRIRYDKKVEADYIYVENGEESIETQVFDLTDEQFNNIISGIDLDELYYLDPEELDPDEVMDGGCVWLFIYNEDDEIYKRCGGFCPKSERFSEMRSAVFSNLSDEFFESYEKYADEYNGPIYLPD